MSTTAPGPIGRTRRGPASGSRHALAAALCLLSGLLLVVPGPLPLPDSVLPCLPCHNRGQNDQVAEWLVSPYSEAKGGRGCTDCHDPHCSGSGDDPTSTVDRSTTPSRNPREAVRLTVTATCSRREVMAEVAVSNIGVGHLLPTGSHERNLVLEIAADARRSTIVRPRLPPFATDVSRYRFDLQERGPVHVAARLMVVPAIGIPREISGTATVCIPDDNGP